MSLKRRSPGSATDDPTKASTEFLRAVELRDEGERKLTAATMPRSMPDIAERLASGDLTPADAEKLKWVDARAEEQRAVDQARYVSIASTTVLNAAVGAIHAFGEDKWLAILKPIAQKAVATKDQTKFDAVHAFAAFLRQPHVAGLASALVDHNTDADVDYYSFGDQRAVYLWRVEHASGKHLHVLSSELIADNWWCISYELRRGALFPSIKEFQPEWKPGLYSARESIDNTLISLDAQEQEFRSRVAPPDSPEPTTKKKRGVVVI